MLKTSENLSLQREILPIVVRAEDFKAEVLDSKLPVLVEFWTPWSRPCRILDSVLQELALELEGRVKLVKVNADESLDLSLGHDIQSVPTLIYFERGNPRFHLVGTATKDAILAKLRPFGITNKTADAANGAFGDGPQPGKEH